MWIVGSFISQGYLAIGEGIKGIIPSCEQFISERIRTIMLIYRKGDTENADTTIYNHDVLGVRKVDNIRNQSFLDDSKSDCVAGIFATNTDRFVYRRACIHRSSGSCNYWSTFVAWYRTGLRNVIFHLSYLKIVGRAGCTLTLISRRLER